MKERNKFIALWAVSLSGAALFLIWLVFGPFWLGKGPPEIVIGQHFSLLKAKSANDLSGLKKAGEINASVLPKEMSFLFGGDLVIAVTAVNKLADGAAYGFKTEFKVEGILADASRTFGSILLRDGWSLVTGGRTTGAAYMEYSKGINPKKIIEIEMVQSKGNQISGFATYAVK